MKSLTDRMGPRVTVDLSKGGRTKQSFAFDSDPNKLMKQFSKSGDKDIFNITKEIARHGDFSEIPDFFTACLQVQAVNEEFLELPSRIRNHVDNDPEKLLDLLSDPSRLEEAKELGLIPESETDPFSIPASTTSLEADGSVQGGEDPPKTTENQ